MTDRVAWRFDAVHAKEGRCPNQVNWQTYLELRHRHDIPFGTLSMPMLAQPLSAVPAMCIKVAMGHL